MLIQIAFSKFGTRKIQSPRTFPEIHLRMTSSIAKGLLTGIACILLSFLLFITGCDTSPFLRNLHSISVVIVSVGIYWAIQSENQTQDDEDDSLNFAQAFKIGLLVTLIAALLSGSYAYVYHRYINPEITEQIILQKTEILRGLAIPEDKVTRSSNWIRMEYSPMGQLVFNFGSLFLSGLILSLLFPLFFIETKSDSDRA